MIYKNYYTIITSLAKNKTKNNQLENIAQFVQCLQNHSRFNLGVKVSKETVVLRRWW